MDTRHIYTTYVRRLPYINDAYTAYMYSGFLTRSGGCKCTSLPVRYAVHVQCVSYREGWHCLPSL